MNEENIYYIIEVCVGGEKLYMYSKRIAVHFPDISKKFVHKRSASRYYKDSEFTECYHRILKYDKEKDEIILWVVFIYITTDDVLLSENVFGFRRLTAVSRLRLQGTKF